MDLLRPDEVECGFLQSLVRLPAVCGCAAANLFQYVFRKNTAASKLDSMAHQFKKYVLTFLTNGRQMSHVEDEAATVKVLVCFLTHTLKLCRPRPYELAFYNQAAPGVSLNDRDLQHGCLSSPYVKSKACAKSLRAVSPGICNIVFKELVSRVEIVKDGPTPAV